MGLNGFSFADVSLRKILTHRHGYFNTTHSQWRQSKFILRGRNFFPHRKEGDEARRADSGDGVLGASPLPTSYVCEGAL